MPRENQINMRQCAICGKGSIIRGKRKLLRGHYNPTSRSRKYPNLQWVRLPSPAAQARGGQAKVQGVRKRICTNCLKSLHKKRS